MMLFQYLGSGIMGDFNVFFTGLKNFFTAYRYSSFKNMIISHCFEY